MKININGRIFDIDVIHFADEDYHELRPKTEDGRQVGFLNFKLNRKRGRLVELNKIKIYDEFQGKGYATALIKAFEYYVATKLMGFMVEGKFYPDNHRAKPFYEKNGYEIEKDGYDTMVTKILDLEKIKKDISPNVTEFQVTEIDNAPTM